MKFLTSIQILLVGAVLFTSCKKDDPEDPGTTGPSPSTIVLSGGQDDAITLTDHIADPNVPDYCVSGTWSVNNNVTIDPGVTICVQAAGKIHVSLNGSLKAIGTFDLPITIRGEQPTPGFWETIEFNQTNSTNNQLIYVNISDAGSNSSRPGLVYMNANTQLNIDNCNFLRSERYGFWAQTYGSNITGLTNSNFNNCGLAPIRIFSHSLGVVDNNNISFNGMDHIEVQGNAISTAQTWKNAIVPYFVKGEIGVNADIVVEPGTDFIMASDADINVSSTGSFKAIGTATQKITFIGENALAGSWGGFVFSAANSPDNILRHCEVAYGGNSSSKNALIFLWLGSQLTLGNSHVHHSQTWGVRNLNGTQTFIDEGNNTFDNNASGNIGN